MIKQMRHVFYVLEVFQSRADNHLQFFQSPRRLVPRGRTCSMSNFCSGFLKPPSVIQYVGNLGVNPVDLADQPDVYIEVLDTRKR